MYNLHVFTQNDLFNAHKDELYLYVVLPSDQHNVVKAEHCLVVAKDMCKLSESLFTCQAELVKEKTQRRDQIIHALLQNEPVLIPYLSINQYQSIHFIPEYSIPIQIMLSHGYAIKN